MLQGVKQNESEQKNQRRSAHRDCGRRSDKDN